MFSSFNDFCDFLWISSFSKKNNFQTKLDTKKNKNIFCLPNSQFCGKCFRRKKRPKIAANNFIYFRFFLWALQKKTAAEIDISTNYNKTIEWGKERERKLPLVMRLTSWITVSFSYFCSSCTDFIIYIVALCRRHHNILSILLTLTQFFIFFFFILFFSIRDAFTTNQQQQQQQKRKCGKT